MTGIKTITAAVLVFASISTAAHSAEVIGQKLATKDWFDYKLTWFSGSPSYVAKWHVMDQGGAVVICGVAPTLTTPCAATPTASYATSAFISTRPCISST